MWNVKEKEILWKIWDKVKYDLYWFDFFRKWIHFIFESIYQIQVNDWKINSINSKCSEWFSYATQEEKKKYFN